MADGYLPAATAAAQILGDIGSPVLLTRSGTTPSPLAQAAGHADRRLRFAAIEAIMKLNPSEPFAGSSHVTDGLGFLASSFGVPRVLVVHPSSAEAEKMAGLAATLGYEADMATNGRAAFELAVNSPDYDFVLIHSAIERPQRRRAGGAAPPRPPHGAVAGRTHRTAGRPGADRAVCPPAADAEVFLQPHDEAEMKVCRRRSCWPAAGAGTCRPTNGRQRASPRSIG